MYGDKHRNDAPKEKQSQANGSSPATAGIIRFAPANRGICVVCQRPLAHNFASLLEGYPFDDPITKASQELSATTLLFNHMSNEVPTTMKRQKRSHVDRAFNKGYQAAMAGRSWSQCPFESGAAKQTWMSGWREGREDHWRGFDTRTHIQKLNNMM